MEQEWMTTEQIASAWGVTPKTVRAILKKEQVNVLRLERKWRVRREDFDRLTNERFGPVSG